MKKIIFFIAFAVFSLPGLLKSQTNEWTGDVNTLWHNAGNWSLGHAPLASEDVQIANYNVIPWVMYNDAVCNNLSIPYGCGLKIYGQTLDVNGDLYVHGELQMLETDAVLNVMNDVNWLNASSANITGAQATINVYGDWFFTSESNVNLNGGFVDFRGTGTAEIVCNSNNSSFYKLRVYKTVKYSNTSTEDLIINNFTFISSSGSFESWSNHDIRLSGSNFNYYGTFDFTKGSNTGSVICDGIGINKYGSGSGVFNNLEFNSTTGSDANTDLYINGDLTIDAGYFDCDNNDVHLEGDWVNNVGPSGFIPGSGTVFVENNEYNDFEGQATTFNDITIVEQATFHQISFIAPSTIHNLEVHDNCYVANDMDITGTLNLDDTDCLFSAVGNPYGGFPYNVNINSLDQGGIFSGTYSGATLNVNDLYETALFGKYHITNATVNIAQNGGGALDLNGEIEMSNGTLNLVGTGLSRWPYSQNATLTMSGGVIDLTNLTLRVYNSAPTLTDNITGGTIRSASGFYGSRSDFTPTAGIFELYGSSNGSIQQSNGCTLYNVVIDKTAKDGGNGSKSNIVILNNDCHITHNLTITSGTLNTNGNDLDVDGGVAIVAGAALQIEDNTVTINSTLNNYGELRMVHVNSKLNVMTNILWQSGSTANITGSTAMIDIYGDWRFYGGANANLNAGLVNFKGSGSADIICNSSNSSFYKLRAYKTVKYSNSSTEDLIINNFTYISSSGSFESWSNHDIRLSGSAFNYYGTFDFTKGSNTGSVICDGIGINKYGSGSGVFNNLEFNSTTGSDANADLYINGDLTIDAGYFDCANNDVHLEGDWVNNVGPSGFIPGSGTVYFTTDEYQNVLGQATTFNDITIVEQTSNHQVNFYAPSTIHNLVVHNSCYVFNDMDITGTLNLDDTDCVFAAQYNGTPTFNVNINSLDQGGLIWWNYSSATLNVNDLYESALMGKYLIYSGTLNIAQNGGGALDLNGYIEISGGTLNLVGTGLSRWPYSQNATLIMSDGIIDLTNLTLRVFNSAPTFTTTITGGTIRSASGFYGSRSDFTPTAGIFELYGSSNGSIQQSNGCTLYNVVIDKTAKDGGNGSKSNTVILNNDCHITHNLTITSGTLNTNGNDLDVDGAATIAAWAALQIEDNTVTINDTLNNYGELRMYHNVSKLNAMSDILWQSGSTADITGSTAMIDIYGDWWFYAGANANLNAGLVNFMGSGSADIICNSSNSSFYKLRIYKTVKYSNTSTEDLIINNYTFIDAGDSFESGSDHNIVLSGFAFNYEGLFDFTKNGNTGSVICNGTEFNRLSSGSGFFNNIEFNSATGSTSNADIIVKGDLTIDAGYFDCEGNDIFIYGNWTNNVGDAGFVESTGTVLFNGANAADINTDETFYNLTLNKTYVSYNGLELDNGIDVHVTNNLNLIDGTMEMNNGSTLDIDGAVTIDSGAGLNVNDEALNIYVGGTWTNTNTINNLTHGYNANNETITFDGTADQNIITTATEQKFGNLVIDKASGNFVPNDNIYVIEDFNLINGTWEGFTNGLSHSFEKDFIVGPAGNFDASANQDTINLISDNDADVQMAPANGIFSILNIDKSANKAFGPIGDDGKEIPDPKDGAKSQVVNITTDISCGLAANASLQNATVNLNGHDLSLLGDMFIISGGTLNADAGSSLKISENKKLDVYNGGTLSIIGANGNNATVTHNSSGDYGFIVHSGGNISAEYTTFEYMGANGIQINPGATVNPVHAFNNCTFQNGNTSGNSAYLYLNGSNTFTATNTHFPNSSNPGNNVFKALNTGNATFESATGDFSGPEYEHDPNSRINWTNIDVDLQLTAILEGPYNGTDMDTDLNDAGLLPLSQPYNVAPWNYAGTESVTSIPAHVVDWVLIELRDAEDAASATNATIFETRAAFILNDGKIVDLDGISSLVYNTSYDKKLFPVIIHRNHLDVISAANLSRISGNYSCNFMDAGAAYGGTAGQKELSTGVWGMFDGDVSGNNTISIDDVNLWKLQAGNSVYLSADTDMDGQTNNTDKNDLIIPNLEEFSQVPGAKTNNQ